MHTFAANALTSKFLKMMGKSKRKMTHMKKLKMW